MCATEFGAEETKKGLWREPGLAGVLGAAGRGEEAETWAKLEPAAGGGTKRWPEPSAVAAGGGRYRVGVVGVVGPVAVPRFCLLRRPTSVRMVRRPASYASQYAVNASVHVSKDLTLPYAT